MINKEKLIWKLWRYEVLKGVPLVIPVVYYFINKQYFLTFSFLIMSIYIGNLYDLKWQEFKKRI